MITNTWNTRLFPKPVGSTANTSFSLRRLFIAMSCSFLRWTSLGDFEDKNKMALCRRNALPAIDLTILRMLSKRWGLFWQVSYELTNQRFTFRFWTWNAENRVRSLQAFPLLTSYQALTCRPRAIFNRRACSQAKVCGLLQRYSSWKSLRYWNQVGGDWKRVSLPSHIQRTLME